RSDDLVFRCALYLEDARHVGYDNHRRLTSGDGTGGQWFKVIPDRCRQANFGELMLKLLSVQAILRRKAKVGSANSPLRQGFLKSVDTGRNILRFGDKADVAHG